ncbi:MAG: hypothetical protein U0174_09875 [Polyangiaceae bacterium]
MPNFPTHRNLGKGLAILFSALAVSALVLVMQRLTNNNLVIASTFGLLLLVSCAGWGSSLVYLVARRRTVDLGLRMVWGMSVLAFVGGVAMLFRAFSNNVGFAMTYLGVFQACAAAYREATTLGRWGRVFARRMRLPRFVFGALLVLFAAWAYLGAASDSYLNPFDDHPAYLPLMKRLLATGTIFEPFSERRALSLGGQTLFQAILYTRSSFDQIQLFDSGVCKVLLLILIWGDGYRNGKRAWHAPYVASVIVIGVPQFNINTASYYSGACFFLALARTIAWLRPSADARSHLPVALVAAGCMTLRNSYAVVLVFMLAFYAWGEVRTARVRWRVVLGCALAFVALLAPWLWLSQQSTGSLLYPVAVGNGNPDALMIAPSKGLFDFFQRAIAAFSAMVPLSTAPLFILGALLVREQHASQPLRGLWFGAVGGFGILLWQASTLDPFGTARYTFPSLAALAIFSVLRASQKRREESSRTAYMVATGATMLMAYTSRDATTYLYSTFGPSVDERLHGHGDRPMTVVGAREIRAQEHTERGAPIAVLLDEPFALDFMRNPIFNFDLPGTLSPKPGMPRFQGSRAVLTYLRNANIRYVIFVRSEFSQWLYRDALWLAQGITHEGLQVYANYIHEFMHVLNEIATKERVVSEEEGIVLVDLGRGP